ncbi:MAG: protein kinase [Gemmatimonadales bacterium]|nr:protein kinase [Gemmatimonadales bacterium]
MDPLLERLTDAMKGAYVIERELGGGGMSRVFVAREVALDRRVVVKILPADLVAGVNVERFRREIQLAARLQQANILPVLTTGEVDGVPYFTMPYVEGESLRDRLRKVGPLPIPEVLNLLRDVARALGAAHEHGIVHRDIKPENVLVSHGTAVVADFGIAKAISAARADVPGGTLTSVGTSVGTPAYIAPEQASGDAGTDHRADLYAFGCMAYELLSGATPFGDRSPQQLFVAHLSEEPEDIAERRPDTPAALARLVMRCLVKEPAERVQSAAEVLAALDAAATSGGHDAAPVISLTTRRNLGRALALYAVSFVAVAILSRAAIIVIGLPDWVFPGALIVMALGLPVILFTALVHHQSRVARQQATQTPGGTTTRHGTVARLAIKASPFVSWRRTALGGVVSVGVFTLLVGAWMVMRAFGIGPAATLFATGALAEGDAILVTEFESPAGDSTLGPVVTEAVRTGLAESRSIAVMSRATINEQLRSMGRGADARVTPSVGREIASREGLKAIVEGEVLAIGGGYVLSARLVATLTGQPIATFKENAANADELIPAIDRVTRKLRERAGESLRAIQSGGRLDRVTTPSFEALRLYVEGNRAINEENDFTRGERLLMQAIHLDTGFAMAYRKIAVTLSNRGAELSRSHALLTEAFRNVDRLGAVERQLTEAAYYSSDLLDDDARSLAAYQRLLDIEPGHATALNNMGYVYLQMRDYDRSLEYTGRTRVADSTMTNPVSIRTMTYLMLGETEKALAYRDSLFLLFPRSRAGTNVGARVDFALGRYDTSAARADSALRAGGADPTVQIDNAEVLGAVALVRGKLVEWARQQRTKREAEMARGVPTAPLALALDTALAAIWFRGDSAAALRTLTAALAQHPLEALPSADRPYPEIVRILALSGATARARAMQREYAQAVAAYPATSRIATISRHRIAGDIALAERRYADAAAEYRKADVGLCLTCAPADLARAYDLAGQADSAIAVFERVVGTTHYQRSETDPYYLAGAHKRLGELYDAKGEAANAERHFAAFVALWKDADPVLQPKVREAQARLAAIRAKGERR